MEELDKILLFKTIKPINPNHKPRKIDPILLETLDSFDWFDLDKKTQLEEKYEQMQISKVSESNQLIIKQRENFITKLITLCDSAEQIDKIHRVVNFLFESNDFNHWENPFGIYKFDGARGDISCDSSSGYDGEDGRMDCWKLEENSRTSFSEISLADVFEYKSWKTNSIDEDKLKELVKIAQIFCDAGLDVYFFSISVWRKGYDFEVIQFEPNNITKVLREAKSSKSFRIYIDKNY